MRVIARFILPIVIPLVLVAGRASAAKPSGGDRTPPAPIAALTVKTSDHALTLRFAATGDDGASGTAAGYDVFYRDNTVAGCADNPGLSPDTNTMWTRAQRSDVTIPEGSGTVDYFNVRPLVEGHDYCLAIRVRDEVPNWSTWTAVAGSTTTDESVNHGDWSLGQPYNTNEPVNSNAITTALHLALVAGQPMVGWFVSQFVNGTCCTANNVVFAGDGWRRQVSIATYVSSNIFTFRMVGNPGSGPGTPSVAAVVTAEDMGSGKNGIVNHYLLVEASPTMAPVVTAIASGKPATGGVDNFWSGTSSVTYILNNGNYDPVATIERVESKISNVKRTTLRLTERVNNVWQDTTVLTHQGPDQVNGFFRDAEAFTKPDGQTLGLVASHCGITVYAERDPLSLTWTYYDAGPSFVRYRVSFDTNADAVVLAQTSYGAPNPVIGRKSGFHLLSTVPAATCASVPASIASNWEVVSVPVDPDLPWSFTSGIAEKQGATFITAVAAEGNYKTVEQQLIYRCNALNDTWHIEAIDRTNSAQTSSQGVMDAAGNLLRSYAWGMFAKAISLGPPYTVRPPDYVYVARHSGNECGVTP